MRCGGDDASAACQLATATNVRAAAAIVLGGAVEKSRRLDEAAKDGFGVGFDGFIALILRGSVSDGRARISFLLFSFSPRPDRGAALAGGGILSGVGRHYSS